MANCAISGPTSGAFKTSPSQMRRPFSDVNQVRSRKPMADQPGSHEQAVGAHHVARADDDLRDQRQRTVDAGEDASGISGMKNISSTVSTTSASTSKMHGYSIAVMHLRFQLLFARLKFRDLRQHHVEKAARLARLHHRHIDARKGLRRFRHRVGQRHAVHHQVVDFLPLGLRRRRRRLPCARITSARLNGTPAASRLDSSRVKFSSSFAETFLRAELERNVAERRAGGGRAIF